MHHLIITLIFACRDMRDSDVDFNANYSDSDDEICINEKELNDYLAKLEENNLFKVNLV